MSQFLPWYMSHAVAAKSVDAALSVGYRGFDTAYNYLNEDSRGNSLQKFLPKYGLS